MEAIAQIILGQIEETRAGGWQGLRLSGESGPGLLAAGASDAWLTAIVMKKGRPAHTHSVLAPPDRLDALRDIVFRESSTIGVREHPVSKRALDREIVTVTVDGQDVRVKVARLGGAVVNISPEYDDVAAVAAITGRPVKAVLAEAAAAAGGAAAAKPPEAATQGQEEATP